VEESTEKSERDFDDDENVAEKEDAKENDYPAFQYLIRVRNLDNFLLKLF
jgi:hypothetical protein